MKVRTVPEKGITERSRALVVRDGIASDQPLRRSPATEDETVAHASDEHDSVAVKVLERVMERENLRAALRQVRSNKGGPGIDGLSVEQLPGHLRMHWLEIRARLLNGTYRPSPVRRVLISKPGGGIRVLGIPTVLDRFIQQTRIKRHRSQSC